MNLNLLALLTAATASIALGIAIYQRTPDRVWNRLFAFHAASIGLWTFCNYLIMAAQNPAEAAIYLRISHPLAILSVCTIVDFAWAFPERIDYAPRRLRWLLYGLGALFAAFGFAPELFYSIELGEGIVNVEYGWPLIPFGLFVIAALAYADLILLLKAFRLEGVQRVQVVWVLVGIAGAHLAGVMAIIVIPLVWGTTAYSGWGAGGAIIQVVCMGYAIGRHHLMRPQVALRRMLATVASVAIVLVVGIALLRALQPVLAIDNIPSSPILVGFGVLMGMLMIFIYDRIARIIRRISTAGSDPQSVQAETASHILRTLDADQLLDYLVHALDDALEPVNVAVYTQRSREECFIPRAWLRLPNSQRNNGEREPAAVEGDSPIVHQALATGSLISLDHVFRFASIDEARELAARMHEMHAQIVAPMIWEQRLIGLLALGPKTSGDMYTDGELRFIADMSLQASLALRNAYLYAETAALKDFNERILRQMDNAVIVTDPDEKVVVFNQAAERLFAISAAQVLGTSIDTLPAGIANCIRASLSSGRVLPSQHFAIDQGERMIPVACSASPLESESDDAQGAVAVISDLTLIQELDRERQEAERLALVRVISAGMAHEIRNPLVAIRTFAELAPSRLDDPEFRSNFLTVAQAEITRIDRLVGDLLTLSKPADAVVEPLDVERVCREVVRATSGMAEARRIQTQLQVGTINHYPKGDSTRLHQALLNIVSNAIDAEPEDGKICIRASEEADERGESVVRIRVHNPGSYIPPEQTEEIFRPFVSKKARGTGLGLAICQTIIEEHNGRISVKSSPEYGTEFIVQLPISNSRSFARTGDA